jgi:small subunit ribosomal protein S7
MVELDILKAVESAPQRRIDVALRMMTQATYSGSFNSRRDAASVLANEIIEAYNMSNKSQAIAKKIDLERQADSAR